jgi:hypothetical protein
MRATVTLLLGQEAYVLWVVGAVVVLLTVVQAVRRGFPKVGLPPFRGPGAGTVVAVVILAVSIAFAMTQQHR